MPRRHYDLDEVLALAESGRCAAEIIEDLGLTVTERAIQKAVNKYLGPLPVRPARNDSLRLIVVNHMISNDLLPHVCLCGKYHASEPYIRALIPGDIDSCVFVGPCCKRAGDF